VLRPFFPEPVPIEVMEYLTQRFREVKQLGGVEGYETIWLKPALGASY
jgi:hypothetical protein